MCCSVLNLGLNEHEECARCKKLGRANITEVEKKKIMDTPNCKHCSTLYPFMNGDFCVLCIEPGVPSQKDTSLVLALTQSISSSAASFDKEASQHRLNRPNSNPNLKKAQATNTKKQQLKLTKEETITIELHLDVINKKNKQEKSGIAALVNKHSKDTILSTVLNGLINETQTMYLTSHYAVTLPQDAKVSFSLGSWQFQSIVSGKSYSVNKEKIDFNGTLQNFYDCLRDSGRILPKDISDQCCALPSEATSTRSTCPKASKHKVPNERCMFLVAEIKASLIIALIADTDKDLASVRPPPVPTYHSSWRRQGSGQAAAAAPNIIEYECVPFKKIVCTIEPNGETQLETKMEMDEIEVPKGWAVFIKGGKPQGSYLGKGMYKYTIKVARYHGKMVALFQHKPCMVPLGSDNRQYLLQELDILITATALLKMFYERANLANVTLPKISCNSTGTFVGIASSPPTNLAPFPLEVDIDTSDNQALLFNTFMVAPLLETCGDLYKCHKFSGNTQTGHNPSDVLGQAVNAFAHHVVEETQGTYMLLDIQGVIGPDGSLVLFDLQAHTKDKNSGPGDEGLEQIKQFAEEHMDSRVCTQMNLGDLKGLVKTSNVHKLFTAAAPI
ncbi:hypothetical protein D9758_009291 [Tetrapyrgos nigripes]|uniref:Alpha-type protein kinase domain-containing protein n=1 Tax=Tetrapyrgos nigripes TaxID=182062 RepID=A0A8H5GH18_9AGAR|nr:hypothetical protein D9758_009291 [Tetrapyrgos nigripes]